MRLSALGTPDLTIRRLGVLLRALPAESMIVRSSVGHVWSLGDHLLATAVDALHAANWQRAGNRNAPRPKPIPRPGSNDRVERKTFGGRRSMTFAEIDARMAAWSDRKDPDGG